MSSVPVAYELPARATQDDCRALHQFLNSNSAAERVEIDASGVERISVLLVQILIAARNHFEKTGRQLLLLAPTHAFLDSLTLIGIQSDYFNQGKPT